MINPKMDFLMLLLMIIPFISCESEELSSAYMMKRPIYNRPELCSKGQIYWCKNITTAVECRALKHCIQAVWEKEVPIEKDTNTVCQTCIEMVKEARDQLMSNETQSEIKEVLEGSCKVIPVKALRHDCDKLMDDFGSYLVDTLASEMNPQVVCSVAGLCNNPAFKEQAKNERELTCDSCHGLMRQIEGKVETASQEDFRLLLIRLCGNLGTYSDACASLVLSNLPQIANLLNNNVKAGPVCSLAGVCTEKFHSHASVVRVDIVSPGDSDVEVIAESNDLPCDLCEQLVTHLRDVLVANTTEEEFKLVLLGLCKQMPSYKDECQDLVKAYYAPIYSYLVHELNGQVLCAQIGICPKAFEEILRPLIPVESSSVEKSPIEFIINSQLPIERLNPLTFLPRRLVGNAQPQDQALCAFCEYFLHFVQQEITLPSVEKKIKKVVEQACVRLPLSVRDECNDFVNTYMDAFIALLANRIDPSQVCPGLGVCSSELVAVEYKDKPTCPLCLFAVEEVLHKISNRTQEDINDALDDLCLVDVFPNSLTTECAKFITSYREMLIDMIIADFTSEEACIYSQLCKIPTVPESAASAGSIRTNEIYDDEESVRHEKTGNQCILCEFVMSKLEKILKDKKTEEEIKEGVYKVCSYMPKTISAQCKRFVEEYADLVIELLADNVTPAAMCNALNLCTTSNVLVMKPERRCLTCEVLMESLRAVLTDADVDEEFNDSLLKACQRLPRKHTKLCISLISEIAPQVETALRTFPAGPIICRKVGACGSEECGLGPEYWCKKKENAIMCQEREYCEQNVWSGKKPEERPSHLKGTDVI